MIYYKNNIESEIVLMIIQNLKPATWALKPAFWEFSRNPCRYWQTIAVFCCLLPLASDRLWGLWSSSICGGGYSREVTFWFVQCFLPLRVRGLRCRKFLCFQFDLLSAILWILYWLSPFPFLFHYLGLYYRAVGLQCCDWWPLTDYFRTQAWES